MLQLRNDAFKRCVSRKARGARGFRAKQNERLNGVRQRIPGGGKIKARLRGQGPQELIVRAILFRPAADRAFCQGKKGVSHHKHWIKALQAARALTDRAGPQRIIKGKHRRHGIGRGVAALRAAVVNGKALLRAGLVHERQDRSTVKEADGRLEAFRQAASRLIADFEAVHHHVHRTSFREAPADRVVARHDFARHTQANEAAARHFGRKLPHFFDRRRRGKNEDFRLLGERERRVHHVVNAASR